MVADLNKTVTLVAQPAYRLINAKFPPIAIFDDVASAEEFEALYAIQQLTNPRLQNEAGNLNLLPSTQIPYGISGSSYACAPFTHVNPDGSRFSDGSFGMLYLADSVNTAIAEVLYHQQKYWQNVTGLHYDSIVMRELKVIFDGELNDLCDLKDADIYHSDDYTVPRILGKKLLAAKSQGVAYDSVRKPAAICWGLMTPEHVSSVIQASHYEFIFNGKTISNVRFIAAPDERQ
ncbi:MAG: hypothetical protein ACI9FJ_000606 [Alteromonadaceae bacterium]